ncbi:MAG: ribonuclease HII [Patescibacteria group bacterium]|nr:ribonuclease HII [Patescibacteria group bacterium]
MILPTTTLEQQLWKQGFINVAGVDEAGKGPLAGPVTAGAVIIHKTQQTVDGVRDSKLMTEKQREKIFQTICEQSTAFGIGIVSAEEIDFLGIDYAVKKAMLFALAELEHKLKSKLDYVIVDGAKTKELDIYNTQRILKGGLYHYSISAGSILAKVTRDRIMREMNEQYPRYGFNDHVGYGTKKHMEAIKRFGPCPIHRKTFEPIRSLLRT